MYRDCTYTVDEIEERLDRNSSLLGYTTAYCFSLSLNHRTTVWIASYADILFAVNRRYHPGEKRLLTYMADLPSRPEGALEDLTKLCSFAGSLSSPIVEHVSFMLKRLDEWLNRVGPGTEEKEKSQIARTRTH